MAVKLGKMSPIPVPRNLSIFPRTQLLSVAGLLFLLICFAQPAQSQTADRAAGEARSLTWLRQYLQIDTTNPPGGEAAAARFLAELLQTEGIESRLLTAPSGRTSLYARLAGSHPELGAVVLLHHIDVVPAGDGWREDPFSGRLREGLVWGRGAIDVKSLGIAHLEALLRLAREGGNARDVIYLAVADEEAGGKEGVGWLLAEHSELFANVHAVLGEGGSNRTVGGRLIWWGIEVAQKRPLWLELSTRGASGHASGFYPQNALHRLTQGLHRLIQRPMTWRLTEPVRAYLEQIADLEHAGPGHVFRNLAQVIAPQGPRSELPAGTAKYFVDTLHVTQVRGSAGINVVAPEARARVDLRLLPDTDDQAVLRDLKTLLGDEIEVEVLLEAPRAKPSPVDHPLFRALAKSLELRAPVISVFSAGTTDSRYFRQRGIAAYGFSPFALNGDALRTIHGANERLPAAAFLRGVETMDRALRACVTTP